MRNVFLQRNLKSMMHITRLLDQWAFIINFTYKDHQEENYISVSNLMSSINIKEVVSLQLQAQMVTCLLLKPLNNGN